MTRHLTYTRVALQHLLEQFTGLDRTLVALVLQPFDGVIISRRRDTGRREGGCAPLLQVLRPSTRRSDRLLVSLTARRAARANRWIGG